MRLLHTSDWHIGRTFHGHSTDEHLAQVLAAIAVAVAEHGVDAVIVAGDIFDTSTPKADAFTMLGDAVRAIREAGATVILTSGNHDGPQRLGHMAEFASFGGVHVRTEVAALAEPVTLTDEHGDVLVYGIPYLHPEFVRAAFPESDARTHGDALAFAMGAIRSDVAARSSAKGTTASGGPRYVVASHCFAAGGAEPTHDTTEDSGRAEERDITRGGLNLVPLSTFEGPDYVALGHIHSRVTLAENVRYCGAPLRFSFGERSSAKGAWLVDLGPDGVAETTWLELPTPREAVRLTGTLDDLLSPGAHEDAVDAWVEVVLTDDVRPRDAMRRIQECFPHAVTLRHEPANRTERETQTYAERTAGKTDLELVDEFAAFVRNGQALTDAERGLVTDTLGALEAKEASR
ncbi:exonuclease SbcCD subunit D C-terminal domain-containing protein [Demequina sp. NBRC 110052]|uniref:exonuclease SbcCD subunit D n=1 Tax=Demequina sp. NBRC 110052 TaxID=1570341 RepID=UPI000A06E3C3|nr:exonuclease SbcCD subunit D C-terminal domain-containing protein [Demequina sp. NBRC 110052]